MTDRNLTRLGCQFLTGCIIISLIVGIVELGHWLGWK
jgi:hypothetical protein